MLSTAQKLVLRELYEKTLTNPTINFFIWTKWVDYRTICSLYKKGLVESSHVKNNMPSNIKLTIDGMILCETMFKMQNDKK